MRPTKAGADIIERMFGSFRIFVGDWAFMKAEEYHHRGLPFEQALAYHKGESIFNERQLHEKDSDHEEGGAHSQGSAGLYEKLRSQVKVTGDSHLKPSEEKEVLPWFNVEVAFNPRDIRGYVLGGYWLQRVGKNDESLKFMREGESNNPGSAQILSAIGELYFKEKNYKQAIGYLERACALWLADKAPNIVTNQYQDSDRLFTFDLLAALCSREGNYEKAMSIYTELLKFGPNPAILERASKLKRERK